MTKIATIRLTPEQAAVCRTVARRHNAEHRKGHHPDQVIGRESVEADELSAMAAYAAERATGLPWLGPINAGREEFQTVGGCQVRATPYKMGGLRVREADPDNLPIILVVADVPRLVFRVYPTFVAGDGKRPEWRQAVSGAPWYRVPRSVVLRRREPAQKALI